MKKLIIIAVLLLPLTTEAQISLGNGLKVYLPYDHRDLMSTSGNIYSIDRSKNGYNSSSTVSTSIVAGKIGQAMSFSGALSGTLSYAELQGSSNILSGVSALSVSAWVYANTLTNGSSNSLDYVFNAEGNSAGATSFALRLSESASSATYSFYTGGSNYFLATTPAGVPKAKTWQLVTGVYSGSKTYIYVNGVLKTTAAAAATTGSFTSNVQIGGRYIPGNFRMWNGMIDDVRIYNRALTQQEITQIYREGVGVHSNSFIDSIMNAIGSLF